ncbi:MAG TPA: TetR/AcrR family transcriptional regulator [Lacibacter sp.]|nr:TetR/AcrR family transcriptional regulator [Lacibacter sp.]HMO88411.1 TetR/AcrR family transcriptional regulator [Lacibacter sp.]HMP86295.1 TetR/AcrR family transcriptional regulator [Lacibacter sp.]
MVKTVQDPSTEEKILAAARQVFLQKGSAGARMQDIADAAGINKALLHYYFRSKEKLFEVIFREAITRLMPRIHEIFDHAELDFFEKIRAFVHAYTGMAMENPYLPLFVLNEMHSNPDVFLATVFPNHKDLPFKKAIAATEEAMKGGEIRTMEPVQLLFNILSLALFPFIARPMFQRVMQVSGKRYDTLLEQRQTEVADFVIHAIQIKQPKR